MPNNNCLEGKRCPECGQEDRFFIEGTAIFEVFDSGTDGHGDIEWGDKSYCKCGVCDFEGNLKDFERENQPGNITKEEE